MTLASEEIIRLESLLYLARRLRVAQKKYFKTRERADLLVAKELESQFDKLTEDFKENAE